MIANQNILINGAGISGLTLAYWLQKRGFSPTIIEKRPNLHERGYMIDFYGSGFDAVEKMNLLDPPTGKIKSISHIKINLRGSRRETTCNT